ncbi:MAG: serine/threonine protein kinase, partial [Woeseia sp.]
MSAESDNPEPLYARQLSEFAAQLQQQTADESLLDNIHAAIQALLSGKGNVEADIRRLLEEQHKAGKLREETYELVKRMLDRIVTEDLDTAPRDPESGDQNDDPFRDTTVIEGEVPDDSAELRLQVGSVLRDRFLLQEKIAGGSMGVVYRALDRHLSEANDVDPWVAVKVLTPTLACSRQALSALQQEAAKGRCLIHPNIVRFIDLDRDDELYFIVMEWLDGRSLASILDDDRSKSLDKKTALDIIRHVAKALDYAHRRGVVHADLKPGNIMVSPDGAVKLVDFGIARVRQKQADEEVHFGPGVLDAKTPAYSSMQVLAGEEPDTSDDVFSLACLMYRLIAGYRVFGPRNAAEAANEGMEPQRPQGVNDSEWFALRKALSYSRAVRYASPKAFIEGLSTPVSLKETQRLSAPDEPDHERRRIWPYFAAVAVSIAAALGLYRSGMLQGPPVGPRPGTTVSVVQPSDSGESPAVEVPADTIPDPGGAAVADAPHELEEPVDLIDFSTLPPATVEIPLAIPGTVRTELNLVLRENEEPAVIDLVRHSNVTDELVVRLEEVAFSGNRSPWESGQYQISDDSMARFPPAQDRARVTVSMTADPLREPDRQVSLLVQDSE